MRSRTRRPPPPVTRRLRPACAALLALAGAAACTSSATPAARPTPTTATSAAGGPVGTAVTGPARFDFRGSFRGPLGVQLYSVRRDIRADVPGTLARVRALGFEEVELAGTAGLSPEQFRRALDGAGLRATSMHAPYERLRDSLPAVLAEARAMGVRYVGVAWIPHPGGPLTAAQARQAAADFDRWGRSTRAQGLQFFYHIHGYEFLPGPDGAVPFDVLARATDPDAVKFEMDVFWAALPGQDPAALLRRHPGRWTLMHLKDMRRGVATGVHTGGANPDSSEVPVGTGQIDYRAVLRAAREAGVERYYLEDETAAPFATLPASTRWLELVRY